MEIVLPLLYLTSGFMFFSGVQSLYLAKYKMMREINTYFGWVCLGASGYQLFTALYYGASDVTSALLYLRLQIFCLSGFLPVFVGFIGCYTGDKYTRFWVSLIFCYSLLVVLVDLFSEWGVRFESVDGIQILNLAWGEQLNLIQGTPSSKIALVNIPGVFIVFWCISRALAMLRAESRRRAKLFLYFVAVFVVTVIYGIAANYGLVPHLYVAGFGFVAVVILMVMNIAMDVQKQIDLVGTQERELFSERLISKSLRLDQARLSQIVAESPHCTYLIDGNGRLLLRNHASRKFFDDTAEYREYFFEQPPWNSYNIKNEFVAALNKGLVYKKNIEISSIFLKNKKRNAWGKVTIFPVSELDGCPDAVALVFEDITHQHYMDAALKLVSSEAALQNSGSFFFNEIARQLASLFGMRYTMLAKVTASTFSTIAVSDSGKLEPNFSDTLKGGFFEHIKDGKIVVYENSARDIFPLDHNLQEWGAESLMVAPILGSEGNTIGFIAVADTEPLAQNDGIGLVFDVIVARVSAELQRQETENHIRRMAYEDYITRLPNRALFNERLSSIIKECVHSGDQAVAYVIDIDHFKTINDALGHDIGDDVLRRVGSRLRSSFDEEMFVARMGGDEFVLLEKIAGKNRADDQAETLAKETATKIIQVMSRPLSLGNRIVSIGASIGVVIVPNHADTELLVLGRADMALYEAKQAGRNCYEVYNPNMQKDVEERLQIEKGLRIALQQNQLRVFYQPRVDQNGFVIGAEALIRWNHPESGFISPAKFIPVAEESGLIHLIGDWVLDEICKDIGHWQSLDGKMHFDISINISAWQFARPDFIESFMGVIEKSSLDVSCISVEITETAILRDLTRTRDKLSQLREQGIRIALDDFGTGYSSLAYLKNLPLDSFKIDRAFVKDIGDSQTYGLVRSMVAIGKHMGLEVTAEGVETEMQMSRLIEMGCLHFQGFLFGRPMPSTEFWDWVKENECNKRSKNSESYS